MLKMLQVALVRIPCASEGEAAIEKSSGLKSSKEDVLYAIAEQTAYLQAFSVKSRSALEVVKTDVFKQFMSKSSARALSLCQNLVDNVPELSCIKKFVDALKRDSSGWIEVIDEYTSGRRPSALVHGDLWAPNILWKDDLTIAGIVDWQLAHLGSPVSLRSSIFFVEYLHFKFLLICSIMFSCHRNV
ncbi:hypothetical protein OESDEN_15240 [Oesophagostomum dentatum]|uniref:CHK kinase-like domain-containing protein n=1 Tax=Oesophagostomum dentatum TaxID=61180 RepID=A0A0B1SJE8_OESDE|nr:hypothetical protein OESDEN_15240 [Oesophagostomum dentatum]